MTCIVGLVEGDKVFIGGDSCGSDNWMQLDSNHPKIFKVKDFIIGGTTSFRLLDLLEYSFNPPLPEPNEDIDRYMRTTFISAVKQCLKDGEFAEVNNSVVLGGNFLVGYKDRLYEIQDDMSVMNCNNWGASVGCGQYVAFGSLYSTKDSNLNPIEKLELALKAAEHCVPGVRGPFHFLNTQL